MSHPRTISKGKKEKEEPFPKNMGKPDEDEEEGVTTETSWVPMPPDHPCCDQSCHALARTSTHAHASTKQAHCTVLSQLFVNTIYVDLMSVVLEP